MEAENVAIYFRGGERLISLAGALLLITFGVLLFKWGISGTASLIAKHDKLQFQLLNASPGLFCFLFGTFLIATAQWRPLKESWTPSGPVTQLNPATTSSPPSGGSGALASAEPNKQPGGMVVYSAKFKLPNPNSPPGVGRAVGRREHNGRRQVPLALRPALCAGGCEPFFMRGSGSPRVRSVLQFAPGF
jgi:hypothetical protein